MGRFPRCFAAFALALGVAALSTAATAAPLAGSFIENRAEASWFDPVSGLHARFASNLVRLSVAAREALLLEQDQQRTFPPGSEARFVHRLTNTGNAVTTYTLTLRNAAGDSFDLTGLRLVRDANGNGLADAGEAEVDSLTLAPGAAADLVVLGQIPADASDDASLTLHAQSSLQRIAARNTDRVSVSRGAITRVVKSALTSAPEAGEKIRYGLLATHHGDAQAQPLNLSVDGVAARYILLSDALPANTAFVSMTGQGVALHHLSGEADTVWHTGAPLDAGRVDAAAIGLAALSAGQSASATLTLRLHANASGTLANTARLRDAGGSTDSNTVSQPLPARPARIVYYADPDYARPKGAATVGEAFFLQADAASCNRDPLRAERVVISLSTAIAGDAESFVATETAPNSGIFRIDSDLLTYSAGEDEAVPDDGLLGVAQNDRLIARLPDCGGGAMVEARLLIDPSGVVFDSRSNLPIAGATVRLIDVSGDGNGGNAGGDAQVFEEDGLTPAPATVVTEFDGRYAFPRVAPSIYQLVVTPPGAYAFESQLPPALQPGGRAIDLAASYGRPFAVNAATGTVTADIPLDAPAGLGLVLKKTATRERAEIGEFVDYTVTVKNSAGANLGDVTVTDSLPFGFVFEAGSARLNGIPVVPVTPTLQISTLVFDIGNLAKDATATLRYRLRLGPGAARGDGINRAQAASALPLAYTSNVASVRVKVEQGVFGDRGIIVGTIAADCAGTPGGVGIAGVKIWLEDGRWATTDSAGRYHFENVLPRTHVLKPDPLSLPAGARFIALDARHAGDGASRFADVKNGELLRADFRLACTPEVEAALQARRVLPAAAPVPPQQKTQAGAVDPTALDPTPAILFPATGAILPQAQTLVRVKGPAGADLRLEVNGAPVPETRIGTRRVAQAKGVEVRDYVGVDLRPGENRLRLSLHDGFGNLRGEIESTVIAPGPLAKIELLPARLDAVADGKTPLRIGIRLMDERGVAVAARTEVVLTSTAGRWQTAAAARELRLFIEGGRADVMLLPPDAAGPALLAAASGTARGAVTLNFLPALRPLVAAGVIEGSLHLSDLSLARLAPARAADGFERELEHFSRQDADGNLAAGARAALFLKGKIRGDMLLTLAYDSDKETREKIQRDFQPDRFYPVYGDSGSRGAEARSSDRLYVRIDKNRSWLLYGDYVTAATTPTFAPMGKLGSYRRSLTGLRHHYEDDAVTVDSFLSRDSTRQVVEEFPANGTSGPFLLKQGNLIAGSEQVEVLARDSNQPALVIKSRLLVPFVDYEIEPLAGRILLHAPLASVDADFNRQSLRVSYEVEQGGDLFWIGGASGRVKVNETLSLGASIAEDQNPQDRYRLASVDAIVKLAAGTTLVAEAANSRKDSLGSGTGQRVEIQHKDGPLEASLSIGRTDPAFDNPSALLTHGRSEAKARASWRMDERTRLKAEWLQSKDAASGGAREGGQLAVERSYDHNLRLEAGVRVARETATPALTDSLGATPLETTSLRARASWQPPALPQASVFIEGEQDVSDSAKHLLAIGGDYRTASGTRLYGRHELVSSMTGIYGLTPGQRHNTTVFGLDGPMDGDGDGDGRVFSEYRVADAISGRDAEAALGLRNRWRVREGLTLNGSFERIHALSRSPALLVDNEATALTFGLAYTANPLWKGTARLELRDAARERGLLSTFGLARKLDGGWSLLGKNTFDQRQGKDSASERMREWLQVGLAYRGPVEGGWNGLGKYELKTERQTDASGDSLANRTAHIVSTHVHWQARRGLDVSGRVGAKWVRENAQDIASTHAAVLVAGRITRDLGERWDAGVMTSLLVDRQGGRQWGLGGEIGYRAADNLWLSVGYNVFGYRDSDLAPAEPTARGVYLRLRFKFDENSLAGLSGK
ncbi:DUF11 domain-containing protein [Thiobacillus denitrificans]|uniref:DUF11 domain-containing protein n=1 Tax=Thiobacillus denitrificans TaxID=36861 RepID=A0A119CYH0_THIDE|nr:DUF11 domain-containing protein [Thiobacillus denitrificans]KVW99768.1 hypothetical protein ABW22_00045 [Thiobacillus denitrificans]